MHRLSSDLIGAVLESAPDAMLLVDPAGAICFANVHVTELFGYSHEQLMGQSVEMLVPERFRAAHITDRQRYMKSGRARPMGSGLGLFGVRADGSEFAVEISLSHVVCEPDYFVVAAIRDMTPHLRVERELQQAREHADRANQAKSRFLATASHDLRQPLQSLSLLAGTLRRLASGADATEAVESLELAIRTMSRLVNALLDVSKLEAGKVKPEIRDFPLGPLFRELQSEFAGAARGKGIDLGVAATDESGHSDPLLVGQILRNLLTNAVRYTSAGAVTLGCRRDGEALRIEVRDTGIGIPPDQLAYIYDEFYQVGVKPGAAREGYGLGLSIVQRLVELLKLRIEVSSAVGRGSTFAVMLPRAGAAALIAAAQQPPATAPPRTEPARRQHLLLIEDDAAVLNAMRLLLGTEGYRVTATSSAEEALGRAAQLADIDIIVSDFHLGDGSNGFDAIAAIRSALGRTTKAILVTGDTTPAMDRRCEPGPALRVVRKPIAADELLKTLRELLGS
jgi:two-component system, sensor histidine kinase